MSKWKRNPWWTKIKEEKLMERKRNHKVTQNRKEQDMGRKGKLK